MIYLLLLPIYPFLYIFSPLLRRQTTNKVIFIHTGKIGDYVNFTSMIRTHNANIDLLISNKVTPLAERLSKINNIFTYENSKKDMSSRFALLKKLYINNYKCIYVTTPNSFNAFLGILACTKYSSILTSQFSNNLVKFLSLFYTKRILHNSLTVNSYNALLKQPSHHIQSGKIIDKLELTRLHKTISLLNKKKIVGITLSSGNTSKNIPNSEWKFILNTLLNFEATIIVYGLSSDKEQLNNLLSELEDKRRTGIISLLGQIDLEDLPENINICNLFISADSGLAYIADSLHIPTLVYAGTCSMEEQRPLYERSYIVFPSTMIPKYEISHIFRSPYNRDWNKFYVTNATQKTDIKSYISTTLKVDNN